MQVYFFNHNSTANLHWGDNVMNTNDSSKKCILKKNKNKKVHTHKTYK